jgi:serine/threonine protein kinase
MMAVEDQLKISSDGSVGWTNPGDGPGKPGVYDAPEFAGREIKPVADVWSLGMMLVEALIQRLRVWEGSEHGEPVLPETLPVP